MLRPHILNETKPFSFLHISKCGGSTFIDWAHESRQFLQFYPHANEGYEHGYLYDCARRPNAQRLVLLRSPRAHVLSMFKECRYNRWGVSLWKTNASHVPHGGTHQDDFEEWLEWYVNPHRQGWLGCYDPWNYQARAMTSSRRSPHDVGTGERHEPSADRAIKSLFEMDWVGITDFYEESLCLLVSRFSTNAAQALFSTHCRCATRPRSILGSTEIVTHGPVDSTHLHVHPTIAMHMDHITRVDRSLFTVALRCLFGEIRRLEARVGHRVLCPEALKEAEPKLAYITNVTTLYENS